MRKHLFSIVLFMLVSSFLFAQKADYRGCNWGDSVEKVEQIEGADGVNISDNGIYYYNKNLGDKSAFTLSYIFKDKKLVSIQWQLNSGYYKAILADLTEKYGEPSFSSYELQRWKTKRTNIEISVIETRCSLPRYFPVTSRVHFV
jgi:hypothetical protein